MSAWGGQSKSGRIWIVATILVVALGFRLASFAVNDALHGDVNLFALTAREFAATGRLDYPVKYEFNAFVPYTAMHSPATQHPPLFPFAGGVVSWMLGTDKTFSVLKGLCIAAGMVLVLLVAGRSLAGAAAAAVMPLLVDYSANASSLILGAVAIMALGIVLSRPGKLGAAHGALAGALVVFGYLIHNSLMSIAPAVGVAWWLRRRDLEWKAPTAAFGTAFLLMLPVMIWNMAEFGRPLYSSAPLVLKLKLGLAERMVDGGEVIVKEVPGDLGAALAVQWHEVLKSGLDLVAKFFWFLGPAGAIAVFIGLRREMLRDRRRLLLFLLPVLCYTGMILAWGMYRQRFLVPIMGVCAVFLGEGLVAVWQFRRHGPKLAAALAILIAMWWAFDVVIHGPQRYYFRSAGFVAQEQEMRGIWDRFSDHGGSGLVLGRALSLDGGLEGVYWNRQPYIHARNFTPEQIARLLQDFPVKYVWQERGGRNPLPKVPGLRYRTMEKGRWFELVEVERP